MRLLDLFCGAGGASAGYHAAGFDVVGVDLVPMPHYPYPFLRRNALAALAELLDGNTHPFVFNGEIQSLALSDFDAIHASPPCQAYSVTRYSHSVGYPDLIPDTRELLQEAGLPYVIENVEGSPLHNPLMLCGSSFGLTAYDPRTDLTLQLKRHRLFESNINLIQHGTCDHKRYPIGGVYGGGSSKRSSDRTDWKGGPGRGGYTPLTAVRQQLMGIDWMNSRELSEAIPPAYTQYIGHQLASQLTD